MRIPLITSNCHSPFFSNVNGVPSTMAPRRGIFTFDAGNHPVHQSDGKDGRGAIGDRAIFSDGAQNDHAADQEHNYEFE